ncbi:hypothetical protein [Cereibacter changlensis]|uniref:hypothetical protein n=1 Tax=Cereibacter changlensis TaxID=402884 RepID=UPI0040348CFD
MEIELRQIIKTASGIANVNWGMSPANSAFPKINLHLISDPGEHTMQGRIKSARQAVIQVDIWHTDIAQAMQLRKLVLSLDGYVGEGLISNILLNASRYSEDTTAVGNIVYRYSLDFRVYYSDAE